MIWKAKEGTHTVKVVVDSAEEGNIELREDNNEAQRSIKVTVAPEEEETIFGIQEMYVYIIAILIVAVVVLGLLDILSWRVGPKKEPSKTDESKDASGK